MLKLHYETSQVVAGLKESAFNVSITGFGRISFFHRVPSSVFALLNIKRIEYDVYSTIHTTIIINT